MYNISRLQTSINEIHSLLYYSTISFIVQTNMIISRLKDISYESTSVLLKGSKLTAE